MFNINKINEIVTAIFGRFSVEVTGGLRLYRSYKLWFVEVTTVEY